MFADENKVCTFPLSIAQGQQWEFMEPFYKINHKPDNQYPKNLTIP